MYLNRDEAGRKLVESVLELAGPNLVVVAISPGGVPVAAPIAERLCAPLDVMLLERVAPPWRPAISVGVVGHGMAVWDDTALKEFDLTPDNLDSEAERAVRRLLAQSWLCRGTLPPLKLKGRVVMLVDDGLLSLAPMRAAVLLARQDGAARVVVAVPVGRAETVRQVEERADQVICLKTSAAMESIRQCYLDFADVSPTDVRGMLGREQKKAYRQEQAPVSDTFEIQADGGTMLGDLTLPLDCMAVVIMTPMGETERFSPQQRNLATRLQDSHLGTFVLDLRTDVVEHMVVRLKAACRWLHDLPDSRDLPVGLLGRGMAAEACLLVAAETPDQVRGVVSVGGNPDVRQSDLGSIQCPTLLIASDADRVSLALNLQAYDSLTARRHLEKMAAVDDPAVDALVETWFLQQLTTWTGVSTPRPSG